MHDVMFALFPNAVFNVVSDVAPMGVLILAGGKSLRMGSPKALKQLPSGVSLLDHHITHACRLNVPIWIADNQQGFEPNQTTRQLAKQRQIKIAHVEDHCLNDESPSTYQQTKKKGAGALAAILSGLTAANAWQQYNRSIGLINGDGQVQHRAHHMMVVSCDSLITADKIWEYITQQKCLSGQQQTATATSDFSQTIIYLQNRLGSTQKDYPLLGAYPLALAEPLTVYLTQGHRRVMPFVRQYACILHMPLHWQGLCNLNTPQEFVAACHKFYKKQFNPTSFD